MIEADFVSDLANKYLSKLTFNPNNVHNLPDVRNFTQNFPPEDYPDRDTAIWDQALALNYSNTSPEFWQQYQTNLEISGRQGILGLLTNYSLDALILPTAFAPELPALNGLPLITVPMGFYPPNTTVIKNARGTLVEIGPNIP